MTLSRAARAVLLTLPVVLAACGETSPDSAVPATTTGPAGTASPSSVPTTTSPGSTIELRLAQGAVVGGPRREAVALGQTVVLRATSDVVEELHVHTYDLRADLAPGQPGEVRFTADIPGRHEVEFETSGKTALTLEVR